MGIALQVRPFLLSDRILGVGAGQFAGASLRDCCQAAGTSELILPRGTGESTSTMTTRRTGPLAQVKICREVSRGGQYSDCAIGRGVRTWGEDRKDSGRACVASGGPRWERCMWKRAASHIRSWDWVQVGTKLTAEAPRKHRKHPKKSLTRPARRGTIACQGGCPPGKR